MAEAQLLALIQSAVRSVWALELLVAMKGRPEKVWSTAALVQELRASATLVETNLALLDAGGLIRREPDGSIYGPASPALEEAVNAIESAYRQRPVSVINLIIGASTDNVQGFADAFRFTRKED